ncbi:unnamed protein product [Symbiodinium pilosum]|uniref:SAP domain-containing protein n=1 Tax=Symbiodinium pilosum TaxID=2952 RepID=A0A812T7G9_SYMPI|nr:unnamed protein product [Symbiodinium pilosum]
MFGLVCGQAGQGKAGLGSSLDGFRSCSSSKRAASAASAGISSAKVCSAGAFFSWGVSRRRLSHRRPPPLAATVAELKVELQNRQLPKTGRKKDLEKRLELAQSIEKMTVKQLKTQLTEQGLPTTGLKAELVWRLTSWRLQSKPKPSLTNSIRRDEPPKPVHIDLAKLSKLETAPTVTGRVRVVMAWGVFVETPSGWGMIPAEHLPPDRVMASQAARLRVQPAAFQVDERVEVELLNAHVDSGCLLLSMREAQRERER